MSPSQPNSTTRHISYRWSIDAISHKLVPQHLYFVSSIFSSASTSSSSSPSPSPHFQLRLYPNGVAGDLKDYLSVGLSLLWIDEQEKLVVRCQFSLIDIEGQKQNIKELFCCFSPKKSCTVFGQFISKLNFLNPKGRLVQNDKLTINCQIIILGEPESIGYFPASVPDLSYIAESNPDFMEELFHDLALKYQKNEFADFEMPSHNQLEETATHHAAFSLTFESSFENEDYSPVVSADTNPNLEFELNPRLCYYGPSMSIKYLSTPNIFANYTVIIEGYCSLFKRRKLFKSHYRKEFGLKSRFTRITCDFRPNHFEDVRIRLKMTIHQGFSGKLVYPEINLNLKSRQQLLLNLKSMFEGGKHSDVALLVEGKPFRVPKAILAAQSPVFDAIFSHESKFNIKSQVSLSHVTVEVFEQFLDYFLTGKFYSQITTDAAIELLQLSEQYSLDLLKQICIKFIIDHAHEVKYDANIEPILLMELCINLAQKYQHNEFPDCVPLVLLPFEVPIEETMTHHTNLSLKVPISNGKFGSPDLFSECAWANTQHDRQFKFTWNFPSIPNTCDLLISYLSTQKIVVDFSITGVDIKTYFRKPCVMKQLKHFPIKHALALNKTDFLVLIKPVSRNDNAASIKLHIYKKSIRRLGSHVFKSFSRQQTLLNMKSVLDGGKHCDVVLLVEGKQFSAHKSILANRSNVFEAMFSHDMKEKMENRVEMHDVKVQVFEQFLFYLYTGKVDFWFLEKYSMDLFVLADMHYISTLAKMCLRMFGQSLTFESVCEQFELADRVGLSEFKQVCVDYMNKTN